ncbi:hypothetical protein HOY82DRAFT_600804 [Tuber indicum]|nr:hypothetical protein HOY82DRAFT_600804 [Tuber indicum]
MENLCSRSGSIREMRIEIGELRNGPARSARDIEVQEVQIGGRITVSCGGGGGGISDQAIVATGSRTVGRHGSSSESKAAEEFVARATRSRCYGRDRSRRGQKPPSSQVVEMVSR